jgi:signal transduction histidine kinase
LHWRGSGPPGWAKRRGVAWWELVVAGAAVGAAALAVWVTLQAEFLANPGWLAAQKADFILGPVFVGLYWLRQRPESRFGPLLIGFGFVGAVYITQSSSHHLLFGAGVLWEIVIHLWNLVLILTFPTGRLDGRFAKSILIAAVLVVVLPSTMYKLLSPHLGPDASISSCLAMCPPNGLVLSAQPSLALDLADIRRFGAIGVGIATGALLIWRLMSGTPPQRRAMAIGAPIALLFTVAQVSYQVLKLAAPDATALHGVVQWVFAAARSSIWYGFLFALIAAQLFAGRALHRLVRQSLRRPSQGELETMLRQPLGDPNLRLSFWDPGTATWGDSDTEGVGLSPPEAGRDLTIVERGDGSPAVAIVHDAQLNDDPELLRAAGAVALLAAENADLDAAWTEALQELRRSRAQIVVAGDNERRKVEQNLHDGVQQRLVAVRINLGMASEHAAADVAIRRELDAIGQSVGAAIDELRAMSPMGSTHPS